MNNQFDFKKIPKFIYLFFATVIVLIVFVFTVGMPLINNASSMKEAHKTALEDIRKYDDAIKRQDAIEAEIVKNQKEFEIQEEALFVDMEASSTDLDNYCRKNNIVLKSYTLAEPQVDKKHRVSTSGYPVNTVKISLTYTDSYDKTMSFLKYLEQGSKGCYYVNNCTLTLKDREKANSDMYDVAMNIELYYYDRSEAEVATEKPTETATKKK